MSKKRQLAAIVFTDISNFTSLMDKDESKALTIRRKQRDNIKNIIKEFDGQYIKEIGDVMTTASACGLGQSAPKVLQGMVKYFSEELDSHITKRDCPTNVCGFDANNMS